MDTPARAVWAGRRQCAAPLRTILVYDFVLTGEEPEIRIERPGSSKPTEHTSFGWLRGAWTPRGPCARLDAMATIIGIAGSLRRGSFNAALLRAAKALTPAGTEVEIASIAGIPVYDADVESEHGAPAPVAALKEQIAGAAGLLLVTPEYNGSIPGGLKNAIDWVSRPARDIPRVFGDKAVAIMGATPGMGGTRLSQTAWLPVLRVLGTRTWAGKQLAISGAGQVFDQAGNIVDPKIQKLLSEFMAGFASFVERR